ncbi:hydrolase [Devosia riboflavina]|uniref:Hydrolase n=1 Tax=Devosia riboflavina TaxID=46914 RepID=A0A087M631_9HYPH|nr:carbon-nitrogen hydrolase family protein [Devosia riboflavina]KFL32334.1 hydrolase [Devosia riboflavina]
MKIAAAQTRVESDIPSSGAAIRAVLSAAAAEGVRLVTFCEGALPGYAKSQIERPDTWEGFDWSAQEAELRGIAAHCVTLGIAAVVGGAHRLSPGTRPHNCLYVFSASGELVTRYDKRFLSNTEITDWYTPGVDPITFEMDRYRFGLAICIESQFPEVFSAYEALGVDAILFGSYGIPEYFQIALRAHAGLNCLWIVAATPAQRAPDGPAGIIGPDGKVIAHCPATAEAGFVVATLDRNKPDYDIALNKARPWRAKARLGDIYRERMVDDARSRERTRY